MSADSVLMRDYYEVLGVRPDATPEEIKRAYKELARRDHPDRNPGSATAEDAFKELAGAYEVLSDPSARVLYDVYGPAAFRERRAGGRPWAGPPRERVEAPAPAVYLTAAEMAAGCAKVLPVPCAACGGQGRDIGSSCPSCGGRGWTPRGERVRIEVPAGVSPGDTLWGEILSGDGLAPLPFTVRARREARPASADATSPAAATRPFSGATRPPHVHARPLGNSPFAAQQSAGFGLARRLRQLRQRTNAKAARVAQRMTRSLRTLSEAGAYPVAVQLGAVARELERVGERQIGRLDAVAGRFSADLTRLVKLLPPDSARAPELDRVAFAVEKRWVALRLAAFSAAGMLVLGTLMAWLIAATIADLPSAALLPGPLAALHRGWLVGAGVVALTTLSGAARRLLREIESNDPAGSLVEAVPALLLIALLVLTGNLFWHAAPAWLERLGLATAEADALPRSGVVAGGGLLLVVLYALGDWSTLGIVREARTRARLRASSLLAERVHRLERARDVALRISKLAQVIHAEARDLPDAVRRDFARAIGVPARESVAESAGEAVQALLGAGAAPAPVVRNRGGVLVHFALDLLAFVLWAVCFLQLSLMLAPALPSWAVADSPVLAVVAALALPLAATLAALGAREGMRRASMAALTHRAVPWLNRPAAVALAVAGVVVLAGGAAWTVGQHLAASGDGALAAFWAATLVSALAVAGLHLDAALRAAGRLAGLAALGTAWVGLRLAAGCVRAAEAVVGIALGELPDDVAAPTTVEEPQRQPA